MSKLTDPEYLKNEQYRDSRNLDARVNLHKRFSTNPQGWFSWVFDTLDQLPAQARVLELGCGPGYLWSECKERIPPGWSITLSDFSEGMLLAAWRNLVVSGRAFKYEQIDAQTIPYPDETFEIVIANNMLYHVPDRPKALREIRRVLKPGGHLVAATGGKDHLKEMNPWFFRLNPQAGPVSMAATYFALENGMEQLKPYFDQVELRRYPGALRITEISPLMAYLLSGIRARNASETDRAALEQDLVKELEEQGEIRVTIDGGLFLAVK